MVHDWVGVKARAWFENLQGDLRVAAAAARIIHILDSETPDDVMPDFLAPYDKVSTVVGLTDVDASYNELSSRTPRSTGRASSGRGLPTRPLARARRHARPGGFVSGGRTP
jgi:hypothetical protein